MASVGHIAVGMSAARAYRPRQQRAPLALSMLFWACLSLLPDADVLGFRYGIRYGAAFGHRGATHSFVFAIVVGVAIGWLAPILGAPRARTMLWAIAVLASHALLDTLTDGGRGCALFWPFDHHRYFAPWRPIPVAPIGRAYLSSRGLQVALRELLLFLPFLLHAFWPRSRAARR